MCSSAAYKNVTLSGFSLLVGLFCAKGDVMCLSSVVFIKLNNSCKALCLQSGSIALGEWASALTVQKKKKKDMIQKKDMSQDKSRRSSCCERGKASGSTTF